MERGEDSVVDRVFDLEKEKEKKKEKSMGVCDAERGGQKLSVLERI